MPSDPDASDAFRDGWRLELTRSDEVALSLIAEKESPLGALNGLL